MHCKLLNHGLALSYDKVVKPCCVFKHAGESDTVDSISLSSWFDSSKNIELRDSLSKNIWPTECSACEHKESNGRNDSVRGNANSSYGHYRDDDIFLEIRPGNTCNFSCQTCWPAASSRVSSHHKQAFGTIDIVSERYNDFSFLDDIKHRIKDIVLLGGEPFYDKNCLTFLDYLQHSNISANLTMFTNGSVVDWDFVNSYNGTLTVVVSMDATGKDAEYIRTGTVWRTVVENYKKLKASPNVNVRVNITCSVYNFHLLGGLVEWLADDWPEIVMIDTAMQDYLREEVVPNKLRHGIIETLMSAEAVIWKKNIPLHQQQNMSNALKSLIRNFETKEFNEELYNNFTTYRRRLDEVKNVKGEDVNNYYSNY